MRRSYFTALLLIYCASPSGAQTCHWIRQTFSDTVPARVVDVAVGSGYVYALGDLDNYQLSPHVYRAVFIEKYTADGTIQWSKRMTASTGIYSGQVNAQDIAVDKHGNSYITGSYKDTLKVGNCQLISLGLEKPFVISLDAAGNVRWASEFTGSCSGIGYGLAVSNAGSLYLTGTFRDTLLFDTRTYTTNGSSVLFIARYNSADGDEEWFTHLNEPLHSMSAGREIIAGPDNDILIRGDFENDIVFDGHELRGYQAGFAARLGSSGQVLWAVKTSDHYGSTEDIELGNDGKVYVAGSSGRYPAKAWIKCIEDGIVCWTQSFPGENVYGTRSESICLNRADRKLYYSYSLGLMQLPGWTMQPKEYYVTRLAADEQGNIYTAGIINSVASFADHTLDPSRGHFFIAKLGSERTNTSLMSISNGEARVYPNPTKGLIDINFSLSSKCDVKIKVKDLSGKEVYSIVYPSVEGELSHTIFLGEKARGIYIVEVMGGDQHWVKRVVLE